MEEVERFEALGDSGRHYTVILWATIVWTKPLSGTPQKLRGGTELKLLDGRDVTLKEPGVFEIFDTEEIIRKV